MAASRGAASGAGESASTATTCPREVPRTRLPRQVPIGYALARGPDHCWRRPWSGVNTRWPTAAILAEKARTAGRSPSAECNTRTSSRVMSLVQPAEVRTPSGTSHERLRSVRAGSHGACSPASTFGCSSATRADDTRGSTPRRSGPGQRWRSPGCDRCCAFRPAVTPTGPVLPDHALTIPHVATCALSAA